MSDNDWFKTTTWTSSPSSSSSSSSSPNTHRIVESGAALPMSSSSSPPPPMHFDHGSSRSNSRRGLNSSSNNTNSHSSVGGGFPGDGPSFTDEENHHHHDNDDNSRYGDTGQHHHFLPGSNCGCTKRRLFLSIVAVAIIGTVVGVAVAFGPRRNNNGGDGGRSSSGSSSSSNSNVGASAGGQDGTTESSAFVTVPGGAPTVSPAPTPPNANEIGDIIDRVARFGGAEFENPQSYQSFARRWVLTHQYPIQDGSAMSTEQQAVQLYAIACIYYNTFSVRSVWTDYHYGTNTQIPGWFSSLGWMDDASDICNWYGLTCNDQGRISKVELDTNGLTGYFPPEVALLHETLQTIDLYNNILHNSGEIGNSFLGELTNLEFLYFGTTSFEYDGVPTHIGRLTKLQELDFSYTLYFGDLPGEVFSNLSNLRYLVMDGNAYNTTLPPELIQLPSLQYLYAGFNFLQGDLEFVSQMPSILELWLDDNPAIGGSIPASIGSASNLASISITNCGLTGTIPPELGNLSNMVQMWMYDNYLTGTIPSALGNLVTMKILNLEKNKLTGVMPSNVCDRRRPFGRLEELEADCDGAISCPDTCCTCCGIDCIDP